MKGLSIGDAVEVQVFRKPAMAAVVLPTEAMPRRARPIEEWLPATVTSVDPEGIYVAFSDGERLAISRSNSHRVRRAGGRW